MAWQQDQNLKNLYWTMQYSPTGEPELRVAARISPGDTPLPVVVENSEPIPVTLGSETITIIGNISVPTTVNVASSAENPVHVHVSEIGSSGVLEVPYMPVGQSTSPWIVIGNVNALITNTEVEVKNDIGNPLRVTGNVNANITNSQIEITNDVGHPIPISSNTAVNSPTNPIYVSGNVATIGGSNQGKLWYLQVAQGTIAGTQAIYQTAYNPDASKDTEASIWYQGGQYPWGSWNTAQYLYMISVSTGDTGQSIFIEGLDSSYNYQSETIVTNGVTAVRTNLQYLRIRKATMTSNGSINANTSNITFRLTNGTGTVVANIGPGFGQTKISAFTIPAGKTAYLLSLDGTSWNSGAGAVGTQIRLYTRPLNQVFTLQYIGEAVNGQYRAEFTVPITFLEKTDLDLRCIATGNSTEVTGDFNMILIDN